MNGPTLVTAGGEARRLSAAASKSFPQASWFDEAFDAARKFAKGEHDGPAAMLLDVVLGMVPVVGQVIDARDILLGLIDVADQPQSFDAHFNLITALIGVVPGGGDAIKRALRSVKTGAAPAEDLLSMMRGLGRGNPEQALLNMLDIAKIQPHLKTLTETLQNNRLVDALEPASRARVIATAARLQASVARQFRQFTEQVRSWLKKQPNNAAEPDYVSKTVPKKSDKPNAPPGVASHAKEHRSQAHLNRQTIHEMATQELNQRRIYFKGILGEHMADYWVTEQGWAAGWREHDLGQDGQWNHTDPQAPRKLNDRGFMTPLWPLVPRGRGIDALWRTNGKNGKPYAVIEAKTYTQPQTPLGEMLADTQDKQEYEDYKQKTREWKGRQAGAKGGGSKRGKGAAPRVADGALAQDPKPAKPVAQTMQMSHKWIDQRVRNATGGNPRAFADLRREKAGQKSYSRHVILFSVPEIFDHSIAIFKHVTGEKVQDAEHEKHPATRVFGEQDIDAEERRRAAAHRSRIGAKK